MPWSIRKRGSQYCVIKDDDGSSEGCHDSREKAERQRRALYASEASSEGGIVSDVSDEYSGGAVVSQEAYEKAVNDFFSNPPSLSDPPIRRVSNNTYFYFGPSTDFPLSGTTATTNGLSTITISTDEPQTEEDVPLNWEGIVSLEGLATGDGRYFEADAWGWRDLPLTLMAQIVNDEGHRSAEVAGRIDRLWKESRDDIAEGVVAVMGAGAFDSGEYGQQIARMVKEQTLRGISADYGVSEAELRDAETGEKIDADEAGLADLLFGNFLHVALKAEIMAATIVATPAFADATISLTATGGIVPQIWLVENVAERPLTASAAGLAPLAPPREWFETPEADTPTPLTVTEDGRVFGHLALWGQCHTGIEICELAPRSLSGYAFFHTGQIKTAEGECLNVGRITVGKNGSARGGHASIVLGTQGAMEHYESTGCTAAFVRAHDGNLGIWLSGAVRSDAPAEKVRDLMAHPPSGDWRPEKGGLELVAALAVPVGGFPIPRYEARLVASGGVEEVTALIATGYVAPPERTRADLRRLAVLGRKAREALTR